MRRKERVTIIGAGFGGIYTAYHLEKIFRHDDPDDPDVDITLISRENYFLMTPLLFEAGSGVLEPRHAVNPVRPMFKKARFVEGEVESIDFNQKKITVHQKSSDERHDLPYDQLVIAVGGVTNRSIIPGSELALGFKTLAEAIFLRNRIIDLFERADVEPDDAKRRKLLTFIIIGGGLVGTELMGELTEFVESALRSYPHVPKDNIRFYMIEAAKRLMPEMDEELSAYSKHVLEKRGVKVFLETRVEQILEGKILLQPNAPEKEIIAETIVLAAGVGMGPLIQNLDLAKSKKGRITVDSAMRSIQRKEAWALGDCAEIPDPDGKPYPQLAQHALREAKTLAQNIASVIRDGDTAKLQPFTYKTMGMMAALGSFDGVGMVMGIKIRGILAWWVWRTYYLMQMTRWERRIRVVLDWTVALFFRNDVVKLDMYGIDKVVEQDKSTK